MDRLFDIEALQGSRFGDALRGDGARNHIDAGDGNDVVLGGSNDDVLGGGPGHDRVDGEFGRDRLAYIQTNRRLWINLRKGTAHGQGHDQVRSIELITGSNGDDRLVGDESNNRIDGLFGADHSRGGDGDDLVVGEHGRDELNGGEGVDEVVGGKNFDACTEGEVYKGCETRNFN